MLIFVIREVEVIYAKTCLLYIKTKNKTRIWVERKETKQFKFLKVNNSYKVPRLPQFVIQPLFNMYFTKVLILSLASLAVAHPGHEEEERRQAVAARSAMAANKRALDKCSSFLAKRGIQTAAAERRQAEVDKQRRARGLPLDGGE
jgi:hypothetical protein